MSYEVEMKFWVDDLEKTRSSIQQLAGQAKGEKNQEDRYFNHPQRDFRQTDEALRLRNDGGKNKITYKGPKLDQETKTRREIEFPYAQGDDIQQQFADLLTALDFKEVRSVRKKRQTYEYTSNDIDFEIVVDEVDQLGTFVEIEASADDESLENVKKHLLALAQKLGLEKSERRSYLELIEENSTTN